MERSRLHADRPQMESSSNNTENDALASTALRGKAANPNMYDVLTIAVDIDADAVPEEGKEGKFRYLGMRLRKEVIVEIKRESPVHGKIIAGDVIVAINDTMYGPMQNSEKSIFIQPAAINDGGAADRSAAQRRRTRGSPKPEERDRAGSDAKDTEDRAWAGKEAVPVQNNWWPTVPEGHNTITVLRFKRRLPMKNKRMPKAFEACEGYDYEVALLFLIKGMRLGLEIKEVDNTKDQLGPLKAPAKVYVYKVEPHSVAAMALAVGDSIVDVDDQPVNNMAMVNKLLVSALMTKGYVRMLIEYPTIDGARNYVRAKTNAMAAADMPANLPLPEDVLAILEKARVDFRNNVDKKPTPIFKETKGKPAGNVSYKKQAMLYPIQQDANLRLLIKVPPPKVADHGNKPSCMSGLEDG